MTVRRKSAAVAPSIVRWSQVRVIVIIGRAASSAAAGDGPLLDRADGEDRRLRRVENGDELLDAEHAEVGDRERAALEVGGLEPPVARAADEIGAGDRDLGDRQASQPAITGTSSPRSVATAIPMLADGWSSIASPA